MIDRAVAAPLIPFADPADPRKQPSQADLAIFAAALVNSGKFVSQGIVDQLTKAGIKSQFQPDGGGWLITVDGPAIQDPSAAKPDGVSNVLGISIKGEDIPPIIDALGRFFGSWKPVVGLTFTGAAFAGIYKLFIQKG